MRCSDHLTADRVVLLESSDKSVVLDDLCRVLSSSPHVGDPVAMRQAIVQREAILSTGIGLGLAVPHARIDTVTDLVIALGVHRSGIEYGSIDDSAVHFVVMVATPSDRQGEYLRLLAGIVELFKSESNRRSILDANDSGSIFARLRSFEQPGG